MKSPRLNSTIFKFKSQQLRRSRNLSCSPDIVWFSAHISSSRSANELWFFLLKSCDNCPQLLFRLYAEILMLAKTFWPTNNINNQPTISITSSKQCQKPITKPMVGHQLNSLSTNQQFRILAYKMRHLPCIQSSWFSDQNHLLAFSLCNVQVFFHVILISCLCFFISFPIIS